MYSMRDFKLVMRRAVPAHQMRRTRAHTVLRSTMLQCFDKLRVISQTQIIVAAKRQVGLVVHDDVRSLRALQRMPLA